MESGRERTVWPVVLMAAFAVNLGMTVSITGRLQGAAFAAAQALGALAIACIAAGRPLVAVRAMDGASRLTACLGGLAGVLGPVAVVAGTRMSDAPAGSVVVFWIAGGWAATAALVAAVLAWRSGGRARTGVPVAGGLLALAGVAGVVANWERPSSFSPLVRFPVQELTILAGGALLLGGAYLVLKAARGSRVDGALVCATAAAAAAGLAWWALSGITDGLASLAERPVDVALAALAWGIVCAALPRVLRHDGPARTGAALAMAPVLLTMLIWVEQAVGVAGPQPFIVSGVVAGVVTVTAAAAILWWSAGAADPARSRHRFVTVTAFAPLVLAGIGLAMPAIVASAEVSGAAGAFSGSWTLSGWESLAGVTGLALAALLGALALSRASLTPVVAGLAACVAWVFTLSTPMHVLTGWLPPGLEQYYGTEYASIDFTGVSTPVLHAAVLACAVGMLALFVSDSMRRRTPADA